MNENLIDKLERKVASLEEENAKLKARVAELEQELSINGYIVEEDEPITVNNYYLKKYIEIHDEVYNERIKALEEKKESLQNEYNDIVEQEKGFETITLKNDSLLKRMEEIDRIISDSYYQLEKERYEFESAVAYVTKKETLVYNSTIESINELIELFNENKDIDEVTTKVETLMVAITNNLYPLNVRIGRQKYDLVQKMLELNELEQKIKSETKNLNSEKKSLEGAIQTISLEAVEALLDGIVLELSKVNKSEQELEDLFKALKEQNLKQIQGEIKHYKVLEYSNKEIALVMDGIIEEYKEKLRTMDTVTNIQLNKTMELSKLTARKAELEPNKTRYTELLNEYQHLESIHDSISSNIAKLEEFILLTNKTIQAKPEYTEFVNTYEGLKATIKIVKNEIINTEEKIKELKEARRVKALDPYAKASIQELTEKIKEAESLLEKYHSDIRNAESELANMSSMERNLKLINVLMDKQNVESKLPTLYNKQRELVDSVNTKYQELKELELLVKEYDEVTEQIEALQSEIDNM